MAEEPDESSFDADDDHDQRKKAGFRPSRMVDMEPCEDLHRYLVDRFNATKSKPVLFEEIDSSTYKPNAKVVSFKTSEDRLLLWIKTFALRYYEYLNTMGYLVSWQEQESYSWQQRATKLSYTSLRPTSKMKNNLSLFLYLFQLAASWFKERNLPNGAVTNSPHC